MSITLPRAALALLFATTLAAADAPPEPPPGGTDLIAATALRDAAGRPAPAAGPGVRWAEAAAPDGGGALEATCARQAENSWDVQTGIDIAAPIAAGDRLLLLMAMRCIATRDETGEARVELVIEQARKPWGKDLERQLAAGAGWTWFALPFIPARDFAAGEARINLRLGSVRQTVQFAAVRLISYGPKADLASLPRTRFGYAGQAADAPWRSAAAARIAALRMGDLRVEVRDADGRPVPGARIRVVQKANAFHWGTDVAGDALLAKSADGERYRAALLANFDTATPGNALKWQRWESHPEEADAMVDWLIAHGMRVRGHNLVWPRWSGWGEPGGWDFMPRTVWERRDDAAAVAGLVERHIRDELGRLQARVPCWDVVNEPLGCHDVMDVLGPGAMPGWYRLARSLAPHARLVLNEAVNATWGARHEQLLAIVRELQRADVGLGGLGIQCHYGSAFTGIDAVYATLDRLSATGLDLLVTEFDINLSDDDQLQADYLRDFMTIVFSHPRVTDFVQWGFWEGAHWRPHAALWRRDWTAKPAGEAYLRTRAGFMTDLDVAAGADGAFRGRAFRGTVAITVTAGGRTAGAEATIGADPAQVAVSLPR